MARTSRDILKDDSGLPRCWWCLSDPLYVRYHDEEWGYPTADDVRLFEKICLEGFQCGLSWLTILRKRENFREAFRGFEIERVARMTKRDVDRLLRPAASSRSKPGHGGSQGIVRHRGKIESTINNARRAIEMIESHGSLAAHVWSFAPARSRTRRSRSDIPPVSDQSTALSKSLRRLGWSFVGPTTMYAFMQAVGMVNDHMARCAIHKRVAEASRSFTRPRSPS
jgi:DNA-3-methyladenine glycosylase I